jgi:hypothetical protein
VRPKASQAAGVIQKGSAVSGPKRTGRGDPVTCGDHDRAQRWLVPRPGLRGQGGGVRFVPGGPPNWTMIRHPVREQAGRDRESRGSGGAQRGQTR